MTTTKTVPPTDQAWTTTDVAEFLRVSVRHVYNLRTTDATFPQPVPVGRALRWPSDVVPEWLKRGGAVAIPSADSPSTRKGAGRVR
jgi:predicted DNA-binding transcriptional regulator AlpA